MATLRKILGKHKATDSKLPQDTAAAASSSKNAFSTGLKSLYEGDLPTADIIFIHGLNGDREKTWTADGTTTPWPQDLLAPKLEHARILTFGYDASVVDWKSMVSKNRINNHSMNLLTAVGTYRENDDTNNRPIIFVAHSLGGLVCQDALLASKNSAYEHLQSIFECTRAILFLGTPHGGSELATWAAMLAKFLGLITQTNPRMLEVLKVDSEVLARIKEEFHSMISARGKKGARPIDITCFYEELPLPGVGEVVPMRSAILPGYIQIGIHNDHMGMTKFVSEDDPSFVAVAGELRRWMKELNMMPGLGKKKPLLMLPFARDSKFVGREEILLKIKELSTTEKRMALTGIGGVGKSQIAIEYCYRFKDQNPGSHVFWVNGSSVQRFEQAYAEISRRLDLPGCEDPKVNKFEKVADWLSDESHEPWLLLLDNTDDERVFFSTPDTKLSQHANTTPLIRYIPQSPNGSVLVTSRNRSAAFKLTNNVEAIVDVPLMDEESSRLVLSRKLPHDQSTSGEILELVKMLDYLPLAIAQAGAYISMQRPRMTIARYLAFLQKNEKKILMKDMGDLRRDPDMPNSVIKTWYISFDQIKKDHPQSAELFSLMSVLDRQGLPDFLFSKGETDLDFEDKVTRLIELSLLNCSIDGRTFGMHRLVQIAMKCWLDSHGETQKWKDKALDLLHHSFRHCYSLEEWRRYETLLPHAETVLRYHYDQTSQRQNQIDIMYLTVWYYCVRELGKSRLEQKETQHEREGKQQTLDSLSHFLNGKHPKVLYAAETLASLQPWGTACEQAVKPLEWVLPQRLKDKQALSTSQCILELVSSALLALRKLDEAEEITRRVFRTTQELLGKEHSTTQKAVINFAHMLLAREKGEEAEIVLRQMVPLHQTSDASLSENYHRLACSTRLAEIFRMQRRYQEAEEMGLSTLTGLESLLGADHLATVRAARVYAGTLYEVGKLDQAEGVVMRALNGHEQLHGSAHHSIWCDKSLLTRIQKAQGECELAEKTGLRALKGLEDTVEGHLGDMILCKDNLAHAYWTQRRYQEAISMLTEALEGYERWSPEGHPRIAQTKNTINIWQQEAALLQSSSGLEGKTSKKSAGKRRQPTRSGKAKR